MKKECGCGYLAAPPISSVPDEFVRGPFVSSAYLFGDEVVYVRNVCFQFNTLILPSSLLRDAMEELGRRGGVIKMGGVRVVLAGVSVGIRMVWVECRVEPFQYEFEIELNPDYIDRRGVVHLFGQGGRWLPSRELLQSVATRLVKLARELERATSPVPASGENRPKGTDEVAPLSSGTSNDVHGGDGASGEAAPNGGPPTGEEAPESFPGGEGSHSGGSSGGSSGGDTSGDGSPAGSASEVGGTEPPMGAPPGSDSSEGDVPGDALDERSEPKSGLDVNADSGAQAPESEETGGFLPVGARPNLDEDGDSDSDREVSEPDEGRAPSPGGADGAEAPEPSGNIRPAHLRLPRGGEGVSGPNACSVAHHGGVYASFAARVNPGLVRRARKVLARMIRGGETAPGPRWAAARVSRKVAGYLRPFDVGDRRLEDGRPSILVMPDVSGSMSAFAAEVVALGHALAQMGVPGAEVITVIHSNGFPEAVIDRGGVSEVVQEWNKPLEEGVIQFLEEWYGRLVRRHDVRAVVIAADWDGAWLYRALARDANIERIYWLDVYASRKVGLRAPFPFPPRFVEESEAALWEPKMVAKVRYAVGCSNAVDFLTALERLLRMG